MSSYHKMPLNYDANLFMTHPNYLSLLILHLHNSPPLFTVFFHFFSPFTVLSLFIASKEKVPAALCRGRKEGLFGEALICPRKVM